MLLPEVVLVKSIEWHHLGKNRGFKSGSSCRETQLLSIITQLETICMNKLGLGDADEAEDRPQVRLLEVQDVHGRVGAVVGAT